MMGFLIVQGRATGGYLNVILTNRELNRALKLRDTIIEVRA